MSANNDICKYVKGELDRVQKTLSNTDTNPDSYNMGWLEGKESALKDILRKCGDVTACDDVKASSNRYFANMVSGASDIPDNDIKFFYKGKLLGTCDPEYMDCPGLYDLMKSDRAVATSILTYMNSLGDPVFPKADDDYEPETNVDNVSLDRLYNSFMQELYYDYSDTYDSEYGFYVGGDYLLPDFEIFDGELSEGVTGSTSIKASSGRVFKTSTIDPETGMEILLSDVSYNHAINWLESHGFTHYDRFDVIANNEYEFEFSEPADRLFVYDEARGLLLGN